MLGQAVRQQQQQQQQHKNLQTIYPAVINKYDEGIARINEKLHVQIEQLISAERIESPRVGSRRGTFISDSTILKIKPKLLKSTLLFFYSDLISIFSSHPSFHLLTTFSRRCLLVTSCHLVWHEYYLLMDLSFERLTTAFIPCFYFRVSQQSEIRRRYPVFPLSSCERVTLIQMSITDNGDEKTSTTTIGGASLVAR